MEARVSQPGPSTTMRWLPVAIIRVDPSRLPPCERGSLDMRITDRVIAHLDSASATGKYRFSRVATPTEHADKFHPFNCIGYRRTFNVQPDFAERFFSAEASVKEQQEHLFFFLREAVTGTSHAPPTELFAIATRQETEKQLKGVADLTFSHRIANHYCFPSYSRAIIRPMDGSEIYKEVVKQQGHLDDLDFSRIIEVTLPVRFNEIPLSARHEAEYLLQGGTMTLWPDAVRLNRWLCPRDLAFLLHLYATSDPNRVLPPDPSLYISCWAGSKRAVTSEKSIHNLVSALFKAFHGGYPYATDFRFIPPGTRPTGWETAKWCLEFNGTFYKWEWQLEASEVLRFLWERLPKLRTLDQKGFGEALQAIKLHQETTEKSAAYSLLNCFEGCVTTGNHHLYRMDAKWWSPSAPPLASQFRRFQQILRKHLIDKNHEAYLYLGWKRTMPSRKKGMCEEEYNKMYQTEPGFLVADKNCPRGIAGPSGIELWDLLKVVPGGNLYIYPVKDGFDQHTRVVVMQALFAALILAEMHEDLDSDLFVELQDVSNFDGWATLSAFGGVTALKEEFQKRKRSEIVFVVAVRPGSDLTGELHTRRWYPMVLGQEFLSSLQGQGLVDDQLRLSDRLIRLLAYGDKILQNKVIYKRWSNKRKSDLFHALQKLKKEKLVDLSRANKALTLFDQTCLEEISLAHSQLQLNKLREACIKRGLLTSAGQPTKKLKKLNGEVASNKHFLSVAQDLKLAKPRTKELCERLVALAKENNLCALADRAWVEGLRMELFYLSPPFLEYILQLKGLSDSKRRLTARCINLHQTNHTNFWDQDSSFGQLSSGYKEKTFESIQPLVEKRLKRLNCLKWFDSSTLDEVSKAVGVDVTELQRALQNDLQPALIDKEGRITGRCIDLLGQSEENFIKRFDPEVGDKEKKKQALLELKEHAGTSLRSTIAMLSIVELAKKIEELGFGFKICPIKEQNSQRVSPQAQFQSRHPGVYLRSPITIAGKNYDIGETRDEGLSPLHAVLGSKTGCWKSTLSSQQRRRAFIALIRGLGKRKVDRLLEDMFRTKSSWRLAQKRRFLEAAHRQSPLLATSAHGFVNYCQLLDEEEKLLIDYFANHVTSGTTKVMYLLNELHGKNLFPKKGADPNTNLRTCKQALKPEKNKQVKLLKNNSKKLTKLFRMNRAAVRKVILENPNNKGVKKLFRMVQALTFRASMIQPTDLYCQILECPDYVYGWFELLFISIYLKRHVHVHYYKKRALRTITAIENSSWKKSDIHVFYDSGSERYFRLKEQS